ncbi:MAG: DUF3617 family protein [Pelovirga sp.]
MNRLLPCLFLTLLLFFTVAATAPARSESVTPRPGLWLVESTTLINGVDLMSAVRANQQQMLADLPPEYREAVAQALDDVDNVSRNYQCLGTEDIAVVTDPHAYLQRVNDEMPECRFEIVRTDGEMIRLKGRCDDADGFSGDFEGELRIVGTTTMRSVFNGKGRYLVDVDLPGIELPENGQVEMRLEETSRWITADCEAVPDL